MTQTNETKPVKYKIYCENCHKQMGFTTKAFKNGEFTCNDCIEYREVQE